MLFFSTIFNLSKKIVSSAKNQTDQMWQHFFAWFRLCSSCFMLTGASSVSDFRAFNPDFKHLIEELCPVCGDKVSGYHYGLQTCESCKGQSSFVFSSMASLSPRIGIWKFNGLTQSKYRYSVVQWPHSVQYRYSVVQWPHSVQV